MKVSRLSLDPASPVSVVSAMMTRDATCKVVVTCKVLTTCKVSKTMNCCKKAER